MATSPSVTVLDYGVSNVDSVVRLLQKAKFDVRIASSPETIEYQKTNLVLPGVGRWDYGVNNLETSDLFNYIQDGRWKKIIGICLGFQILGRRSEEGDRKGLGILDFECKSLAGELPNLKKINSGWRETSESGGKVLTKSGFYFTHSFGYIINPTSNGLGGEHYSHVKDTAILAGYESAKVLGLQFHPEKSHSKGLQILERIRDEWI